MPISGMHIGQINQGELDTIAGLNEQLPFAHEAND
jgi:hypothetical protein